MISSSSVDKAALGLREAAAVAMFVLISKSLPGFFKKFVANFFTNFSR